MAEPAAADTIGPYRLLRRLGQGALGTVFLAANPADDTPVALKVLALPQDPAAAQAAAQLFAAEAAAVRSMSHPDIVTLRDAGQGAGVAWLAMEVAPGVTLDRYTQPSRLLPEALVLRLGQRLAGALAHAHAAGVVHRDVKPANVIVDLPADSLKLTDFGLARLADAERTRTGLVLGSPDYLSPEQLAGAPASAAGDLYALGVTLFELLCGRRPHEAPSMGELLRRVASEPAPALDAVRPGLPPALGALLAALLAKRPSQRPTSAAAVAGALGEIRGALAGTAAADRSHASKG